MQSTTTYEKQAKNQVKFQCRSGRYSLNYMPQTNRSRALAAAADCLSVNGHFRQSFWGCGQQSPLLLAIQGKSLGVQGCGYDKVLTFSRLLWHI
jgi:hypothetical protein